MFLVLLRRLLRCASSSKKLNVLSTPIAWPSSNCVHNPKQSFYLSDWWQICGRFACCVTKMRENSLSESANLFKDVNVIEICTEWFGNVRWFELSRINLTHGSQNWFELSGVSRNRGWNCRAWVKQIQGKQSLVRDIGRFGKLRVREIGIPL